MSDVALARIPVMKPWMDEAEASAAAAAIMSGWVAQGPRVAEFERLFAARVAAGHGVAVSSCTTALHLGLVLLGVGPGDEVVVPSLSFIATSNAVRYVGATPVFADVDLTTGNLTGATVEAVVTPRTRAVVLVHQGGMPADVADVTAVCRPHGIAVLEDAACAAGSTYRGRPVGAGAALAAWSFHPRKLLTTGEGGMLTLMDQELAVRARRLREHGMSMSAADRESASRTVIEEYLEVGFNYRMTDIQAAVGLVQLGKLDTIVQERRRQAARLRELLSGTEGLILPVDPPHGTSNYQSFVVRLAEDLPVERNTVLERLAADGISARRGIMAAHLEPAYREVAHIGLPATEELTHRSLILPVWHGLTDEDQERIARSLIAAVGRA
jgi:dTDP-4-amino-4,6-dideoxygalactose transaminase